MKVTREDVLALYRPGVFGHMRVAATLGVSKTTVRRLLNPDYAERMRVASREAKRRRTGICERCGGETKYNGHRKNNGPSRICWACSTALWTHCSRGHELTPENRLYTKTGAAWCCRICRNAYMREYSRMRYATDPVFREKKRQENQRQYVKRKSAPA